MQPRRSSLIGRALAVLVTLRIFRRHGGERQPAQKPPPPPPPDPSERKVAPNRGAETVVAVLLLTAAVSGFGFTAAYALPRIRRCSGWRSD